MRKYISKIRNTITIYLSHRPGVYALIVGIGIVWFWRGVWHCTDLIHVYFDLFSQNSTIDSSASPWWDGALSLFFGTTILYFTNAFTSSFIGNELILSGLRKEAKIYKKDEEEIRADEKIIVDIKKELNFVAEKIDALQKEIDKKL